MVKTFATNENNDLYIGNDGSLVIVTGLEAVLQACATAVKAQRGEMIYQTNLGVPNFQAAWDGGTPNLAQYEAALYQTFLSVSGVTAVQSLTVTANAGTLSYTAIIETDEGTGTVSGNLTV